MSFVWHLKCEKQFYVYFGDVKVSTWLLKQDKRVAVVRSALKRTRLNINAKNNNNNYALAA